MIGSEEMVVSCPTLVIEAGNDATVTADNPARYLEVVPEAHHIVVPEASHGWVMGDPDGFAAVVSAFLRDVSLYSRP